jgi:hypothetical protein
MTAAIGLLVVALRQSLGGGGGLPDLFTARGLSALFLQGWPELLFALGLLGGRRWARDLAAPLAGLGLASALGELPRYGFLALRVRMSGQAAAAGVHTWSILGHALGRELLFAVVCAGTLYALTRPELIRRCQALRAQPDWTDGLSFWALLLISHALAAVSDAALSFLVQAPGLPAALSGLSGPEPAGGLGSAAGGVLQTLALLALALAALIGLWKRRIWGWLAMALHCLTMAWIAVFHGAAGAMAAYFSARGATAAAALPAALEVFSRGLPELGALVLVAFAVLKARAEFRR